MIPLDFNRKEFTEENTIQLPLKYLKSNGNLKNSSIYITEPFYPPKEMFKIYVKGFDPKGNPLKQLISTAIKAEDGG